MMVKNILRHGIVSVSALSGNKMAILAVYSVILLTWASPVLAGFEWKAPVPAPTPVIVSTQPAVPAVPAIPVQNSILWDKGIPKMPTQRIQDVEYAPIIVNKVMTGSVVTDKVMMDKTPKTTAAPLPVGIISGFGTELPLKIALQQVIPPTYKVSLSPGVNSLILVSWRGEKPWEQVLTDMLSTRNLGFSRQNNVITISMLPIIYPSVLTPSSSRATKNTTANKADMIPTDMISGDKINRVRLPSSVEPHFNTPTSVVVAPIKSAPKTNIIRINSQPKTEKPNTVTIRRDKPTPNLISRILHLNNDKEQNKAALQPKKIVATKPSVKKSAKKTTDVFVPQKASISTTNAISDNKKVDLTAYYQTEQASKNKKADMIPTDMISNSKAETSIPTMIRTEKPASLTNIVSSLSVDKHRVASTAAEPKVEIAKIKITGVSPNVSGPSWSASGGQTLRMILSDWSRKAKVELHWDIDYDYRLNEDIAYKGSFNNAVEKLLDRYTKVRPQPYGRLIQKNSGDNILIVNSYDLSH